MDYFLLFPITTCGDANTLMVRNNRINSIIECQQPIPERNKLLYPPSIGCNYCCNMALSLSGSGLGGDSMKSILMSSENNGLKDLDNSIQTIRNIVQPFGSVYCVGRLIWHEIYRN